MYSCYEKDSFQAQRDSQTHLDGQKFLLLGWKYLKKDVRSSNEATAYGYLMTYNGLLSVADASKDPKLGSCKEMKRSRFSLRQ
ncbi:hypothetical protein CKAN_00434800 [Cinnamomum micranthum f. kanehirae]|uniref:Uncharacterized protein n=1 Tax=Cinnamomum micranthum f. kanehirae TaxID=337451 RepID=A0A3S3NVF9_9MAGN|nr:hypothetical protein CKAN_00434800 [Cinnamomum micranthum f. kanehirae]